MTAGDRRGCPICDTLDLSDLTELDLFMGDASRWPSTIWGIFDPPKGAIGPRRQWFGMIRAAQSWFAEHGMADRFSGPVIRQHARFDVTVIATDAADLLNRGVIAAGDQRSVTVAEKIDPDAFLTYFSRGIAVGNRSLEILATRLEAEMQKGGEDVSMAVLFKLAEIGAKLATTQATLRSRGTRMGDADDSDEGFRAGAGGVPSPRMGHARIRTVDGEARPIADEGPADREHFSERSRQEGGEGLPH